MDAKEFMKQEIGIYPKYEYKISANIVIELMQEFAEAYASQQMPSEAIKLLEIAKCPNCDGSGTIPINTLDGNAKLFHRTFNENFDREWTIFLSGEETEIDNNIVEQIKFDSDLWVLEVEDKNGRHFGTQHRYGREPCLLLVKTESHNLLTWFSKVEKPHQ